MDTGGWLALRTPRDVADAVAMQNELKQRLELTAAFRELPSTVCGLEVSYDVGSDRRVAAAVVVDIQIGEIKERVTFVRGG